MDMAHTALALNASWKRLRPLIQKAIPFMGGTHDEADLLKEVMEGRITFWPGQRAFVLAAIERFPKLTRLNLVLAGGDYVEADQIGMKIMAWGKMQGATQMIAELRPGLDRNVATGKRAASDFTRRRTVYVREI